MHLGYEGEIHTTYIYAKTSCQCRFSEVGCPPELAGFGDARLAQVEVTSEDPAYPIEAALNPNSRHVRDLGTEDAESGTLLVKNNLVTMK
jgi:hypothetical protein